MPRNRDSGDPGTNDTERLIAELREAVRARDEFIAIAAHELRNPMTPVLLRVSTLATVARRPNASPEALAAGLEDLRAFVQNYIKRATMLLDVSRVTTGNLHLDPQALNFSDLVRRLVAEAEPIARHVGSEMRLAVQDGVCGVWDPLATEQIVENLLSNALKYGAGKPVEIELSVENERARLVIRDQGNGISPADRARIFERFERAVTGSRGGGFGIGLWLVGRLVDAMNGDIAIDSEVGAGSTFMVTLPLKASAQKGTEP
jgi:two-component system, OmpR family, sensor kinase